MQNIVEEDKKTKRPSAGTRFPPNLQLRMESYIREQHDEETSAKILQELHDFIQRNKGYGHTEDNKNKKFLQQTLFHWDEFSSITGISAKTYFEYCMGENKHLKSPNTPGWTFICWPSQEAEQTCALLNRGDTNDLAQCARLIASLQPPYYQEFKSILTTPTNDVEFDNNRTQDKYGFDRIIQLNADNLGDRMRTTLEYLRFDTFQIPRKICDANKLVYKPMMSYFDAHYWTMWNLSDIWRFCQIFELSPHWALFGRQKNNVLARNAEIESVMDEFCLLPKVRQQIVLSTIQNIIS